MMMMMMIMMVMMRMVMMMTIVMIMIVEIKEVINHYLTQELFENVLQYQKIPTISNNKD